MNENELYTELDSLAAKIRDICNSYFGKSDADNPCICSGPDHLCAYHAQQWNALISAQLSLHNCMSLIRKNDDLPSWMEEML